ncbi:ubiquitin carboxyl-terminal hydrolase 2 [Physcomitrium patens]|uniref:USP domain-containing protein n=1 Tax=Physcomitrium patens TaxID=3218 RepID=A0A2K1IN38_PHYPA|nr:ubiquitin carboxyl-terminal hydrolase 2-like [Physcomitrium patens]XP_024360209.1 ubiquitin carboxyl-terminal hydrolase 2-like [Physcomitrium patens]XP_024360210.1 ubiquitin carboxyl-terminal hydrolase 2-like [Physcomitrium patens]PNR30696.1 hypothetical protein PHYPA_027012 [Physcomitrium patens]|eukprot:XP_024360208.1 ubiquitin carboxyl-terminal hydrolase 2-like [Physcomitrella patens]
MGKRQKKKQARTSRNIQQVQRANASKQAAASIMSPVPLSSQGTSVDDSTLEYPALNIEGSSCCQHVESSVNLDQLRSQVATKPSPQCHDSILEKKVKGAKLPAVDEPLWTCLASDQTKCGSQIVEAKVDEQNDDCSSGFPIDVSHLKTQKSAAVLQDSRALHSSTSEKKDAESEQDDPSPSKNPTMEVEPVRSFKTRRVMKGLMNLGNTCFFNSVMQNLVGVRMLREHFSKETIAQEGVLKLSLRKFFMEMDPNPIERSDLDIGAERSTRARSFGNGIVGGAVNPKLLFSEICKKAPRFRGFQQQDSHELLRCLLDGLHMEEESIRKARTGADKEIESATDSKVKENGSLDKVPKRSETLVEYMFGGQFSSTVTCCECGHSSVVYEPFLDLSLPIPSKQSLGKISEPMGVPILFAPQNKRENSYGNGILSSKAPQSSTLVLGPVDDMGTVIKDKKRLEIPASIVGFNLECCARGGGGVSFNTSDRNDLKSEECEREPTTGDKEYGARGVGPPATPISCEIVADGVACSSTGNYTDPWFENAGEHVKEIGKEGVGTAILDDQRVGSATSATVSESPDVIADLSRDVEANSQGVPSTEHGGGVLENSSRKIFSAQELIVSQAVEPVDVKYQMEEVTVPYGPHLPSEGDGWTENKCMALVLLPPSNPLSEVEMHTLVGCSEKPSAGNQSSMNQEATSTSDSKLGSIIPAEEEGEIDVGIGGLFDDTDYCLPSRNDTASVSQGWKSDDFACSNSMDALVVSDGRSGSARVLREEDSYPTMSLEGCLQAFTKAEVLSGENAWACENCTRIAHSQLELDKPILDKGGQAPHCLNQSFKPEDHSNEIGPSSDSNSSVERARKLVTFKYPERCTENLSSSMSMMLDISQGTDESGENSDKRENGGMSKYFPMEMFNGLVEKQNDVETVDGRAGADLDVKEEYQPLSSSKDDTGEPYVMVDGPTANADETEKSTASSCGRSDVSSAERAHSPDRNGTASVRAGLEAVPSRPKEEICAKKLETDAPKLVSVKRDATKRFLISKAPLVLTVHLKRFAQDSYGRLSKLGGHITFHEQLDLGPFVDQRDGVKQDGVYQLIGTVEHSGTMRGGHYVGYVKGESDESIEGTSTWYYISDSHVRKTSLEDVLQSEAYLLFYERLSFD